MSIESMNAYGYTDSDMLPLSKELVLELFERDVPVYMLYDDNSEGIAFEAEDIVLFSGCFGISREDWDAMSQGSRKACRKTGGNQVKETLCPYQAPSIPSRGQKGKIYAAMCGKGFMMNFNNDEMNLMCIYDAGTRTGLMEALSEMRKELSADETELLALTDSTLNKLSVMTDEDYDKLELYPDFDE